jgi:hypothetical protein
MIRLTVELVSGGAHQARKMENADFVELVFHRNRR